jgi:hypothetical protein
MPAGRPIPYSKQITKLSRRLIEGAKISASCDLSALGELAPCRDCSQLSGSAPNLIQINGIAIIAMAQAAEKDL